MKGDQLYRGIKHVVYVSSNEGAACEHCSESVGLDRFAESINHYVEKHGYRILHVGTQTDRDDEGLLWHHTVAVLGK